MTGIRRSAIWPDSRVKPRFGAVEIDWQHPLSVGLVQCFLFNEQGGEPTDLVTGRPCDAAGVGLTRPAWSATPIGLALDGAGDRATAFLYSPPITSGAGVSVSALAVAKYADSNYRYIYRRESATHILLGQNASNHWMFGVATHPTEYDNTVRTVVVGEVVMLVGTNDQTTTKLYTNGVLGENVGPFSTNDTTTAGAYILSQAATSFFGGVVSVVYVHRRPLTMTEAGWLHAEPFAFVRPLVRRRWFVPSAAPTVFPPRLFIRPSPS